MSDGRATPDRAANVPDQYPTIEVVRLMTRAHMEGREIERGRILTIIDRMHLEVEDAVGNATYNEALDDAVRAINNA